MPLLQSSDMDTIMGEGSATNGNEPSSQNGYINPQLLSQHLDENHAQSYSGASPSQDGSSSTMETAVYPDTRNFFLPTGCCFDTRMKLHANADFADNPHHPEDPRRIEAIMDAFRKGGLLYTGPEADLAAILKESPTRFMLRIPARKARRDEVCLVHSAYHYSWVQNLKNLTSQELREMTTIMDNGRKSLYVGNLSYEAALVAAGGAIETCKNVVTGRIKNGIAVIRPPGHHAEQHESMGFCIFNNVPIAAKVCMVDYPEVCRKVLILDWDVHHGNGIQNMFYDDPNVLYISLHVYQNGRYYPFIPEDGTPDGDMDKVGSGLGMGKNVNIGWQDQGMGDGEYMAAFQRIVMPIAYEFDPDLVIISAGFDAAAGDELGGCFVTPACYSHMTHMLMTLAHGKVAVCLEGGYDLKAISASALSVAKTLMGEPPERMIIPPINHTAKYVIDQVKIQQAPYWECMRAGTAATQAMAERGDTRMDIMVRTYQRLKLQEEHKMVNLYIQRDHISEPFENQVLITPNIHKAKVIVLIIHDPPLVIANLDPITNRVDPAKAYMHDPIAPYIRKFVSEGYGVIDINMPTHVPAPPFDTLGTADLAHPPPSLNEHLTKELLTYIWDNYLESGYDSKCVVLMGVGHAYIGAKQLLINRDCKDKIAGIVGFVSDGSLKGVKSETDPDLAAWYQENSEIYVSPEHACWTDEAMAKRVRKARFGKVIQSPVVGLSDMLNHHLDSGLHFLKRQVKELLDENAANGEDSTEDELSMPYPGAHRR